MSETAECKGTKQNAGKYDNSRTSHLLLQNLVNSIHPETPGQIPRPARFPFGKKAFFAMARTVWRPVISGLPSAAPKGARTVWRPVISGFAQRRTERCAYSLAPRHFRIAQRHTERCAYSLAPRHFRIAQRHTERCAYSLAPLHFRIAQRHTERCKEIEGLRGGIPMYRLAERRDW